jgi:hypothetical protein
MEWWLSSALRSPLISSNSRLACMPSRPLASRIQTRNVHCPLAELSPSLSKIDTDLPFIGRIAAPFDMA